MRVVFLLMAVLGMVAIFVVGHRLFAPRHPAKAPPPAKIVEAPGAPLAGTDVPLPAELEGYRAQLEAALAPSARLQPGGEPVARLGGKPGLPAGVAWPRSPRGAMSFLGALDLAALHRAAPEAAAGLPASGQLLLFYDAEEQRWGFEPSDGAFFKLLHVPAASAARTAPKGAETFPERVLGAKPVRVLGDDPLPGAKLSDADADALYEHAAALAPEPDHRVGGPPSWIQDDGRLDAAITAVGGSAGSPKQVEEARRTRSPGPESEWQLLWQLDSDDAAGFMWGDAGRLYVLIRTADLRAGRFDRAWLVLQCY
ncbi:MAG: YwqG family protein [Anaeromyxobacter sp.]